MLWCPQRSWIIVTEEMKIKDACLALILLTDGNCKKKLQVKMSVANISEKGWEMSVYGLNFYSNYLATQFKNSQSFTLVLVVMVTCLYSYT